PDVPHAQHMPSHIFTRLGAWDDAIASNTRSAAAARAYEVERGLTAMWDQRAHALDYLAYAYLQQGRDTAAQRVLDEAAAAPAGHGRYSQCRAPRRPGGRSRGRHPEASGDARARPSRARASRRSAAARWQARRRGAGVCGDPGALAQPGT